MNKAIEILSGVGDSDWGPTPGSGGD